MILGVLSDTHGQGARTRAALQVLREHGATHFVHCGDVGGEPVLNELAGLDVCIVCGNTDCPDTPMVQYAASLGLRVGMPPPRRLELDGRHIVVFHGHEPEFARALLTVDREGHWPKWLKPCDYLLHGHTHIARCVAVDGVTIINPGALHRAVEYTVATIDLQSGTVAFHCVTD